MRSSPLSGLALSSTLTNSDAVVIIRGACRPLGRFGSVLQAQTFGFRAHFVEGGAALDVALVFEGEDIGESQSTVLSGGA